MKVVYNACYGGFGLSDLAREMYIEKSGKEFKGDYNIERNDPILVEVVEKLEEKASNMFSDLQIQEIPDGAEFEIDEYDGMEGVVPPRQSW